MYEKKRFFLFFIFYVCWISCSYGGGALSNQQNETFPDGQVIVTSWRSQDESQPPAKGNHTLDTSCPECGEGRWCDEFKKTISNEKWDKILQLNNLNSLIKKNTYTSLYVILQNSTPILRSIKNLPALDILCVPEESLKQEIETNSIGFLLECLYKFNHTSALLAALTKLQNISKKNEEVSDLLKKSHTLGLFCPNCFNGNCYLRRYFSTAELSDLWKYSAEDETGKQFINSTSMLRFIILLKESAQVFTQLHVLPNLENSSEKSWTMGSALIKDPINYLLFFNKVTGSICTQIKTSQTASSSLDSQVVLRNPRKRDRRAVSRQSSKLGLLNIDDLADLLKESEEKR